MRLLPIAAGVSIEVVAGVGGLIDRGQIHGNRLLRLLRDRDVRGRFYRLAHAELLSTCTNWQRDKAGEEQRDAGKSMHGILKKR